MKEYKIYVKTPPIGNAFVYMLTYYGFLHPTQLGILLDAVARGSSRKYISILDQIGIAPNVFFFSRKYVNINFPYATKTGGILTQQIHTRTDEAILTRGGIEIEAVHIVDELPVLLTKALPIDKVDPICVDAGGNITSSLSTRNGEAIITRDGFELYAIDLNSKSLSVSEIKTTLPKPIDFGLYETMDRTILLTKYADGASTVQIKTNGKFRDSILDNYGNPILTRDGIEIETVQIVDGIPVSLTKALPVEETVPIRVDAGGIVSAFLESQNGACILTRDGIEIETVQIVDGIPLSYKASVPDITDSFCLYADVRASLMRYRILSELDDFELDEIDDMTLRDLDFVVL